MPTILCGALYHSDSNRIPYRNEKLDALLVEQLAETDPVKRNELFADACKILWDDAPIVFLFGTVPNLGHDTSACKVSRRTPASSSTWTRCQSMEQPS